MSFCMLIQYEILTIEPWTGNRCPRMASLKCLQDDKSGLIIEVYLFQSSTKGKVLAVGKSQIENGYLLKLNEGCILISGPV